MPDGFIAALEAQHGAAAKAIQGAEFRRVNKLLLERFFANVKQATGRWVYHGYRWHGYSFNHETALCGEAAFAAYRKQPIQPFFIYHELEDSLFDCVAPAWPNVAEFDDDIYVFPHDMNRLFTATHEMSMGLGPYFARPSAER